MALFKIYRGDENGLNLVPCHNGYAYFTEDSGKLFIDIGDNPGDRVQVNAYAAEALMRTTEDGTIEYIEVDSLVLKDAITAVERGGTGASNLTVNALLIGNGTDPVKMISIDDGGIVTGDATSGVKSLTGSGILYALTNGAPQFGIAPIEVGGTGANTAVGARNSLDVYSREEVSNKVKEATSFAYSPTLFADGWVADGAGYRYSYENPSIQCGKNGNIPPIITYSSNRDEYSKISGAEATPGTGITFTIAEKPANDIGLIVIDVK